MEWLHYLGPPILGALIGYATNFLAIKMLFWPRKAVYIGKWRVPFTPGVIPKRKNELAHAIAELVAVRFFTKEDIQEFFLSDEMRQAVACGIARGIDSSQNGQTIRQLGSELVGEYEVERIMTQAEKMTYLQVCNAIMHSDIFERVEAGAGYVIRRKLSGSILQHIVSERQMESIGKTVTYEMKKYMYEHLEELLLPVIVEKAEEFADCEVDEIVKEAEVTPEMIHQAGLRAYEKFVEEALDQVVGVFDIAKLTETKIVEMNPKEIAELSNQVIRREMQAVIYLGALLGAVIGLVNLLF